MTSVAMSARLVSASPSVVSVSVSSARPTARAKATGVVDAFTVRSKSNACVMRVGLACRGGIVKRDDEIAVGGGAEPALDDGPRLEIVGERDGAKVMAERRAKPRRRRLHRGHPWRNLNVELQPLRIVFDGLEHSRRHRKHARIAAGNDGDRRGLPWRASTQAGRAPFQPDCRSRARVGPAAMRAAPHTGRSRQCRSHVSIAALASGVIHSAGPGPSPTIMTRPVTGAALSPARE